MGHFSCFPCSESPSTSVYKQPTVYTVGCLRISASGLLGLDVVELSMEYVRSGSFNIKLMSLTKKQNTLKGGKSYIVCSLIPCSSVALFSL